VATLSSSIISICSHRKSTRRDGGRLASFPSGRTTLRSRWTSGCGTGGKQPRPSRAKARQTHTVIVARGVPHPTRHAAAANGSGGADLEHVAYVGAMLAFSRKTLSGS
jgi:hypothetical protein